MTSDEFGWTDPQAQVQLMKLIPYLFVPRLPCVHFHSQQLPHQYLHQWDPQHSQIGQATADPAVSTDSCGWKAQFSHNGWLLQWQEIFPNQHGD
jgi:hypothetical protein